MSKLRLTLAIWEYDRTRALADGSVRPEGIDLECLNLHVEETFFRMARHREFEVSEMSLSSYTVMAARGNAATRKCCLPHLPRVCSRCHQDRDETRIALTVAL